MRSFLPLTIRRDGMSYKIQYLGLGGILDQAIAIVKNHFGLLFSIMLLMLVPFSLIVGLLEMSVTPELPADATVAEMMAAHQAQVEYAPVFMVTALVSVLFILPVTNASVMQAVARIYLGQPVTAVEAVKHGFRRLGPLLWTNLLMMLAIFGGFILLIVPGILFMLWFGLGQEVVVLEGISGTAALGRSKKLVRNHLGTFLILGLIIFIISIALGRGTALVAQPHLQLVVVTLCQAAVTMLSTAALVVFYFSCRCAEEHFDLHFLAESIGAPPAAVPGEQANVDSAY
jgi:hypothetical protein